jgi:hypothetical protein
VPFQVGDESLGLSRVVGGLLKVRQAVGIALADEDVPELAEGSAEVAELVTLGGGAAGSGRVQRLSVLVSSPHTDVPGAS